MKNWTLPSVAGLAGLLAFIAFGGLPILNVTNISFLLDGDAAQHWVGWEFFRHTPFMQWPIGNNTAYGMELNNSIVYTDSIPIFAILFKIISPILPVMFQYTGIWLASCFILQGVMGFILIKKLTNDNIYSLISAIFFLLSSAMTIRIGGHFALSAHWLLLAGMILFFDIKQKNKLWLVIILISSLVHAYILAMVLSIWIANLTNRYVNGERNAKNYVVHIAITMISLVFVMYAAGYFNISGGVESDGFGFYKLNLNSIFNPLFPSFSSIISPMPVGAGDYEGLNYLGFGILTLISIIFISLPFSKDIMRGSYRNNFVFIVFCILLTIFALSSNISIGTETLVHLTYPSILDGFTSTFRSTGRFFWIVFYAIIVATLVTNHRIFRKSIAISLLIVCALVQIYDAKNLFPEMAYKFSLKHSISQPKSTEINELSKDRKYLIGVPPEKFNPEWKEWAYFASIHNMHMNFGYFARYSKDVWNKQSLEAVKDVNAGELNKESIYMFKDKKLFDESLSKYNGKVVSFQENDSYFIIPQ